MGNLKKFWKMLPIRSISAEKKITFLHDLRLLPTENLEGILEDVFRREYIFYFPLCQTVSSCQGSIDDMHLGLEQGL